MAVDIDWVRNLCLSFPGTTEQIQWGDGLVFKVAGRIHAIAVLVPADTWLMFKVDPESFAEMVERPGVIPAPYLARAKWVSLETKDALPAEELAGLLRASYDMIVAKLPRKTREAIASGKLPARETSLKKTRSGKHHRQSRRRKKKPSR